MRWLFAAAFIVLPFTASAASFLSVDNRADIVNEKVKGNHSYHAYLAKKFADYASEEVSQHDLSTAKAFINMAEDAAAKAGGAK